MSDWLRSSRRRPCLICEKPDWCSVSTDGSVAICMRVTSDKPTENGGWLHRLTDDPRDYRRPVRTVRLALMPTARADLPKLAAEFQAAVKIADAQRLAHSLSVSLESLQALGLGWSKRDRAWSFPMLGAVGQVRGIRLRGADGSKWAVRGGKEGLFVPDCKPTDNRLVIVEGVTDCAALLDLGFHNVAGRPSCSGGTRLIVELVNVRKPHEVVIVADRDEPGQRGASVLASTLLSYAPVRVIRPPVGVKDVRAWKRAGGTHADVERLIRSAAVRRLKIGAAERRDG